MESPRSVRPAGPAAHAESVRRPGRRGRLGHERPGSVLRGPQISVICRCGARAEVFYGGVWRCERCDLRWDTTQIPHRDYELIRRTQLRFRLLPIALGLATASLALFFTLTHDVFAVFALVPMTLVIWLLWIRPIHRRRYRAALANLPRWELRPTTGATAASRADPHRPTPGRGGKGPS